MRILKSACAALALGCAARAGAQQTRAGDALDMFRQQQLRVTYVSNGDTTVQRGQPTLVRDGRVFLMAEDRTALSPIPVADIVKIELFRRQQSLAEEEVRVVGIAIIGAGGISIAQHSAVRGKHGASIAIATVVGLAAARPLLNAVTSKIFEPQRWVTVFSK